MAKDQVKPAPLVTEPVPIFETFVTGVASADDCGDFIRVTLVVDRPLVGTPATERAVVTRLIVPAGIYSGIVEALASAEPDRQDLAVA